MTDKTTPYLLVSDTHYHPWSQFSTITPAGINSRLQELLDETIRAAEELKERGGHLMIHAGDVFHVRGVLTPTCLNSVCETYRKIKEMGISIYAISGNHDLEWEQWARISSAVTTLGSEVITPNEKYGQVFRLSYFEEMPNIFLFHWNPDYEMLLESMKEIADTVPGKKDAIIHAPVEGVLSIPGKAISVESLVDIGFDRVFAGHYHNHKDLGGGVYSIGALSHYTWGDVGSKPGYVFVYPDRVEYRAGRTPRFVDIPLGIDDSELFDLADGNYVRFSTEETEPKRLAEIQNYLKMVCGAKGVQIKVLGSETKASRTKEVVSKLDTMDKAVEKYVGEFVVERQAEVRTVAMEVYQEVLNNEVFDP